MIDWQPIETAPKGRVLLYFPRTGKDNHWGTYNEMFQVGYPTAYLDRPPTNWAHLDAPKTTNKPTAFGPNLLRIGREET